MKKPLRRGVILAPGQPFALFLLLPELLIVGNDLGTVTSLLILGFQFRQMRVNGSFGRRSASLDSALWLGTRGLGFGLHDYLLDFHFSHRGNEPPDVLLSREFLQSVGTSAEDMHDHGGSQCGI